MTLTLRDYLPKQAPQASAAPHRAAPVAQPLEGAALAPSGRRQEVVAAVPRAKGERREAPARRLARRAAAERTLTQAELPAAGPAAAARAAAARAAATRAVS